MRKVLVVYQPSASRNQLDKTIVLEMFSSSATLVALANNEKVVLNDFSITYTFTDCE